MVAHGLLPPAAPVSRSPTSIYPSADCYSLRRGLRAAAWLHLCYTGTTASAFLASIGTNQQSTVPAGAVRQCREESEPVLDERAELSITLRVRV
eukprot:COSAG06_NODE_1685_length_8718_cov_7.598561_5_plen_94_part_00